MSGRLAEHLVAWALLGLALAPTAARAARTWRDPIAEHGPLVVAMAAWLLWRRRAALAATPSPARPLAGGVALALALWIVDAAALEPFVTVAAPAALLAVAAHVAARHGLPALRLIAFPLAFCLFALPAPGPALFSLSVRLQLLAAQAAAATLDALGLAVVRVGSTLHLPGAALVVDDGCSGLRGLMAVVAFAALMAHLARDRRRGLAALAVAVPAALAANVLRVVVLSLLVGRGHTAVLEGAAHQATGLAVYAVALGLVLLAAGRTGGGVVDAPPAVAGEPPGVDDAPLASPLARAALMGVVAVFACLALVGSSGAGPTAIARRLPERLGPFVGAPAPLSPAVFEVLGDDVAARRFVVDPGAPPVDVVVVHSADDPWRAYHPPDNCFLIGGWELGEADERRLPGGQRARRRVFRRGAEVELVYYWVRLGDQEAALEARAVRLALFLGRLRGARRSDATLVRLGTSAVDGLPAAEARLAGFAARALGPLTDALASGRPGD